MKPKPHSPILVVLLIALLIAGAGCSGTASLTLTEADNGATIEVAAGTTFTVRLQGNPTTGFTWEAQDLDTRLLRQVGETEFESSNDQPGLVGAGGTLVLRFTALEPGATTLTLVYHRPWETNVEPADRFTVTVIIK